jgi:hypothetical protein
MTTARRRATPAKPIQVTTISLSEADFRGLVKHATLVTMVGVKTAGDIQLEIRLRPTLSLARIKKALADAERKP